MRRFSIGKDVGVNFLKKEYREQENRRHPRRIVKCPVGLKLELWEYGIWKYDLGPEL